MGDYFKEQAITLQEARLVLGTTGQEMTDLEIMNIVAQVEVLTDIAVAHLNDSRKKPGIDLGFDKPHNS